MDDDYGNWGINGEPIEPDPPSGGHDSHDSHDHGRDEDKSGSDDRTQKQIEGAISREFSRIPTLRRR